MKRKKRKPSEPTFIEYNQEQSFLFPPSIDEMIPDNHIVRVVNSIIDNMDLKALLKSYRGGGRSSYHPKMMLKVIIFAYTQKIYSSRGIAKALRENIHFMWLSGMNRPDFRTINRFRVSRLRRVIDEVFYSVVVMLQEMDLIKLDDYFLDGTIIEANANKYTWVWRKSVTRYKSNLEKKVKALLVEIDKHNDDDDKRYGDKDLPELGEDVTIDSEYLEEKIKELDEILAEDSEDNDKSELRKASKQLHNDFLPRLKKYEKQEKTLGKRNSYSKTDTDATFMRMKDDHMRNGQLKPGYNIQVGTENQFIVGYSIHQKTTDAPHFIPHMQKLKSHLKTIPKNIIADSGYGSEENYSYIDAENLGNYVKYNYFHMEQKRSFKKKIYRIENMPYDPNNDEFTCPALQKLKYVYTKKVKSDNGYQSTRDVYQAEDCNGCSHREQCHKSKYNRKINISHELNDYKQRAKENLLSDKGLYYRSKRPVETESVFGQIKNNKSFTRFLLRGLDKINIEWGLVCIAHNLSKIPI